MKEFNLLSKKINKSPVSKTNRYNTINDKFVKDFKNLLFRPTEYIEVTNFIPAGRLIISLLQDKFQVIDSNSLDKTMLDFVKDVNQVRNRFRKGINGVELLDYEVSDTPQLKKIKSKAKQIIQKVLKGNYKSSDLNDEIYFDKNYVTLNAASSGQQESNWIFALLYMSFNEILDFYTFIEEPEAHLYPSSQKDMVELISLLFNSSNIDAYSTQKKIFITTHSPYILSALNNLLYAHVVGNKNGKKRKIERIVEKEKWIDPTRFACYYVDKGIRSIVDKETGLIKVTELEREVMEEINSTFDNLYDIDG